VLSRLPIRWRLAGTSAALTFAILCVFALVIGQLTERRIRSDFSNQVAAAADDLRDRVSVRISADGHLERFAPNLDLYAGAEKAVVRVLTPDGIVIRQTNGAPRLGQPPFQRTDTRTGYRIETRPITLQPGGELFVQYARRVSDVEATLGRLRFFLLFGVVVGTALALLAGLLLARRAMAPIAALTATAEEIRRTGDLNRSMPRPTNDDEVGRLTSTLDEMLVALESSRSEMEGMLSRQRQFIADASHELRTPLTSVLANLELLADTLEGEHGESARSALRSSHRMRRLVVDLLLLARADSGRPTPPAPVDLGQVVLEAAAELEPVTGSRELVVDVSEAIVDGVRDDLHRVALNLIENALKHTPEGAHILASVARDGTDVVMSVSDNGPGVPADQRDRVFDRFARGESDRGGGSFGLGLSIVRAVAEGLGGSVAIEDAPGSGARFVVRLPASQSAPKHRPDASLTPA